MMNNINMIQNNMNMMNNLNMMPNNMNMMNNLNMIQNNNLKIGNNNVNQINNAHKITNANNMIKNENMSKNNHNGVKKEENLKKKESNKKLEDKALKEKSLNIKNIIEKIEKNMNFENKNKQGKVNTNDNDELQFISIKDELTNMVNGVIFNYLNGKKYDADKAQTWCNNISDEIIKALHQQQRGFKFVCATTIIQKGESSLHFSSTCFWNPAKDGSITVKFENEHMHCFVSLFGITK